MKTGTFPSLSVSTDLREAAESALLRVESLSGLIETAVRETMHRRQQVAEFLACGLHAGEEALSSGNYHAAATVHDELQRKLDARPNQVLG